MRCYKNNAIHRDVVGYRRHVFPLKSYQACGAVKTEKEKKIHQAFRIAIDDNKEIKRVKETVFLGVTIDEHLTWKSHVALVANKISKSIDIIRRRRFFLTK